MPFQIIRNDIVNMKADAIVNTANPSAAVGSGTDTAIHEKAGPGLLEARKTIGNIRPGSAAATPAFGLDASYVIHTVGPVWRGGLFGEAKVLRSCYAASLKLAWELGCKSVAFPLISTGNYGFPKDKALHIATQVFSEFLADHEMQIWLVVFGNEAFRLSEKLFRDVSSYIDEHYVQEKLRDEYGPLRPGRNQRDREFTEALPPEAASFVMDTARLDRPAPPQPAPPQPMRPAPPAEKKARFGLPMPELPSMPEGLHRPKPAKKPLSLEEQLKNTDAGFSETLLKLIDKSGKKDSAVYSRANVSRQHFSKIRNNPNYKPTKSTAIAFAIALELNLDQTIDLIGRAGYALTRSSKFDVIIMYFIETGNYNLYDINAVLFEFDQSLLGA